MAERRELRSSAAGRLKDTFRANSGILLPHMQRYVMRLQSSSDWDRRDDILHPSDMASADWCPRHDYYRMTATPVDREAKANPSFTMDNIFAEGHSIHTKYQEWLWGMDLLYGKFLCLDCGRLEYDHSPLYCTECKGTRLVYRELDLTDDEHMIAGHTDGAIHGLKLGATVEDFLVEIKSVGIGTLRFEAPALHRRYLEGESIETLWREVIRPFPSHMKQGQLYLWLSHGRYRRIIYIYENKANQQVKEFVVSLNEKFIADLLVEARDVAACIRQGKTPDRPYWAESPDSRICHSCPYHNTCWGLSHDPQTTSPKTSRIKRTSAAKRRRHLNP